MYRSAAFWIPPPRLGSMTEIQRRQAADIVIIIHFLFFSFSFFSFFLFLVFLFLTPHLQLVSTPPRPPPSLFPVAPDHSPSQVRSPSPPDSHLHSKPTPSLSPSMHPHLRELEPS